MGFSEGGEFNDVLNDNYLSGVVTVQTTETELKVGGSRLSGRELLTVYNKSNSSIYVGPSGVTTTTGIEVEKGQLGYFPYGDNIAVYAVVASGTADVVVQEAS